MIKKRDNKIQNQKSTNKIEINLLSKKNKKEKKKKKIKKIMKKASKEKMKEGMKMKKSKK